MNPILNIAIRAARKAGNIIMQYSENRDNLTITEKSLNDFVTNVDKQAEHEIIQIIRKAYPDHQITAEESGLIPGNPEFEWVIDPLDGTTNFLHGFSHFAVSIAVLHKGKTEYGLVYDPIRNDLYTATKGGGAYLNDKRIRVSPCKAMNNALLATGFPSRNPAHLDGSLSQLNAAIKECSDIRLAGAASLDLAYVAAGKLDGYWEAHLKSWDLAAGALLVKEAGGFVSDYRGGEEFLTTGNIVAATPKIFKRMLQIASNTQ